jgi:3(or 17)beta-hydroxysteroid dehydrogenase
MSTPRLAGRIALVTGAARGIGLACVKSFVTQGATVIATDLDITSLGAAVSTIGQNSTPRKLDVRLEDDWQRITSAIVQEHGFLDIVINNAGITGFVPDMGPHDPEHASLEAWRAVHATNLDGVFLGCKHAIAAMKPPHGRGGSIINISSRSGQVGVSRAAAYASSKAAVRNHTKSVALYCAEMAYGIRCNSIHPGAILTPMWDPMLGHTQQSRDTAIAQLAAEVPLGRMGTPEDVAMMAVYLASDESSYVTGAEFVIDGGILAGSPATPRKD